MNDHLIGDAEVEEIERKLDDECNPLCYYDDGDETGYHEEADKVIRNLLKTRAFVLDEIDKIAESSDYSYDSRQMCKKIGNLIRNPKGE